MLKINYMSDLLLNVSIQINEKVYLKNPESSELGKRIIEDSIELLDEIGFDAFTFKKLSQRINSTEASVYRYFESKHKLLLYLTNWYWNWMEYKLVFSFANVNSSKIKLEKAIRLLTEEIQTDSEFSHVNEVKLSRILISESSKAFLTKNVDDENKDGVFLAYKQLVERVSQVINDINPKYKYPHMLVSTVIEGAHQQRFFGEHLPRLTDKIKNEDSVTDFYLDTVFKAIGLNE